MAGTTITNRILTLFTASGQQQTVGAVNQVTAATNKATTASDNLTRNTTRLGQASASAGRSFSAQSKGMGGLVGTYAAAAATVFTLQQAFSALSAAARAETVVAGTNTLAQELSASGPAVIKRLQEITQGQLTLAEAATAANIALSAGFDTTQLNQMAEVAQKASRALGRDFTDALTRVTRGISKLEPELLDELGIFTRIDPAVAAYARTIGKAANQLTEYERRQAFATAALAEGERKFSDIDTASSSAQKSLEQLRVNVIDLATGFGQILLPAASSIADFFTGKLGNSLLLFLGIFTLVFSKGISVIDNFVGSSLNRLSDWSTGIATYAAKAAGNYRVVEQAVIDLEKQIEKSGRATPQSGTGSFFAGLTKSLGAGTETGLAGRELAKEANAARARMLSGVALSRQQMEADARVFRDVQEKLVAANRGSSAAFNDAKLAATAYASALEKANWQTRALTVVSRTLSASVTVLSAGFRLLQGALVGIGVITAGLSIFGWLTDTDPLGAIGNWIKGINSLSNSISVGLYGSFVEAAGGIDLFTQKAMAFGADSEYIESLQTNMTNLFESIKSEGVRGLAGASAEINKINADLRANQMLLDDGMQWLTEIEPESLSDWEYYNEVISNIVDLENKRQQLLSQRGALQSSTLESEALEELSNRIADIDSELRSTTDLATILDLNRARLELTTLQEVVESFGIRTQVIFSELANTTGLSTQKIAEVFSEDLYNAIIRSEESLEIFGVSIQKIGDYFTSNSLSEPSQQLLGSFVQISSSIDGLGEDMLSASVNTTAFSASVSGLRDRFEQLQEEQKEVSSTAANTWESMAATAQQQVIINNIENTIQSYEKLITNLEEIEAIYKSINATFGTEQKLFDNADAQGLLDSTGNIATTQEEINQNQVDYLASIISASAYTQDIAGDSEAIRDYWAALGKSGDELKIAVAGTNAEAEAFQAALDAMVGTIFKLILDAQKLSQEFDKASDSLRKELDELRRDGLVLDIELRIDELDSLDSLQQQLGNIAIERLNTQLDLIDARENAGEISEVDAIKQSNVVRQQILDAEIALEYVRHANAISSIELQRALIDTQLANDIANIQAETALLIADTQQKQQYLTAQAASIRALGSTFQQAGTNLNQSLADTFTSAASVLSAAIASAVSTGMASGGPVSAGTFGGINIPELETAMTELDVSTARLIMNQRAMADERIGQLEQEADTQRGILEDRLQGENAAHDAALERLRTERVIEDLNTAGALADAASSGGGGEEIDIEEQTQKIIDQYRDLQEQYTSALENVKSAVSEVISSINTLISTAITANKKARLEYLETQEEFAQFSFDSVSDKLETVQDSLNESLEDEIALRQELEEITKTLVESQTEYMNALSAQGAIISESVSTYVENLLEQKAAIVELNKASLSSQALGKEEATLVEQQLTAQENLDNATRARLEAETELEQMEKYLAFTSELLTNKFSELTNTFTNLFNKIQAFLGITSAAGDAGILDKIGIPLTELDTALQDFNSGLAELAKLQAESSVAAQAAAEQMGIVATTSVSAESVPWYKNSTTLTMIGSALAGGMTGFGIGQGVSQLVGDTGWATTIGGTIGGALAGAFQPALTSMLTSVVGQTISGMLSFAIPIVGSVIGAFIGSLFKKTPRASASGTFGPEGYETESLKASGGASMDTAEALDSIANQTLTGIVSGLEAAGIQFVDTIETSISMSGDKIKNATLQYVDSTVQFTESSLGKGQAGAEAAAAFYTEAFFKGLRVERNDEGLVTFRSLVVDSMTPNAEDLQAAIDVFAELEDTALKTSNRFSQVLAFAQSFNDTLLQLTGTGNTTEQVFNAIEEAASANANTLASYYSKFLTETENTFGEASSQFEEAQAAVRANALAQIGLVEQVIDGTTQLISITEATEDLNAGAILINDIVTTIAAMGPALEAAGITNIDSTITTGINTSIEAVLTEIGEGLEDAIALLENPAMSAVYGFESLLENNATRLAETEGALAELEAQLASGVSISQSNLDQAALNVELAKTLNQLEIEAYLAGLTEAELKAIDSTMELDEATQALVDAQLEAIKAISEVEGLRILIDTSNELYEVMGDLTNQFIDLGYAGQQLVGSTSSEFYEILGGSADEFNDSLAELSEDLSGYTMAIASGTNITDNYEQALEDLNSAYAAGLIDAEQYALGMEEVNSVTIEYIEILNDVYDAYVDNLKGILDMLDEVRGEVQNSIENLGNVIVDGVERYIKATQDVLRIFDETLAGVAQSGNALFDLRDRATKSLQDSNKALKDFEKQNLLTGRTSAQINAELATVQQELNSMLANPVDLSGFLKLNALTTQQTKLQNELNVLTEVEAEYQALLADKNNAINDLSYVESTIISLGDDLIDTRKTESEIIRETQEAVAAFVKGQEDLLAITNQLAAANFNLNQFRINEEDAVYRMTDALNEFSIASDELNANISEILGSDGGIAFIDLLVSTAAENTRQYYEQLGYSTQEVAIEISEATASAREYAQSLVELSNTINLALNPDLSVLEDLPTNVSNALTYEQLVGTSLTDTFREFNSNLIQYLDTDGLRLFFGAGGVFESFSNSLKATLITDGFDLLTMPGGPLENFNTYLQLTSQVITKLTDDNAIYQISIEAVTTSVGTLVTALGVAEGGFTTGAAAIMVSTDTAVSGINNYATAIGNFNIGVTGAETNASISILTTDIPEAMDKFVTVINVFNETLQDLSISTVPSDISTQLVNEINILDSDLNSIDINGPSNLASMFEATINAFNSNIESIEIIGPNTLTDNITAAINVFDSTIGSIVITGPDTLTGNIKTAVNALDSTIGSIVITGPDTLTGTFSSAIELFNTNVSSIEVTGSNILSNTFMSSVEVFNSEIGSIAITGPDTLTGNFVSEVNSSNSIIGTIDITGPNVLTGNFVSEISDFNSVIGSIAITGPDILTGNFISEVSSSNSNIGSITITGPGILSGNFSSEVSIANSVIGSISITGPNMLVGAFISEISAFNSTIASISITGPSELAGDFISEVTASNSSIGSIVITGPDTLTGNFINTISAFNSSISAITITGPIALSGKITTAINTFNSSIGAITITGPAALVTTFTAAANAFNNTVSAISFTSSINTFKKTVQDSITNSATAGSMANIISSITLSAPITTFNTQFNKVIVELENAFDKLLAVFTPEATSEVTRLTTALSNLNTTVKIINSTDGLNKELGAMNTQLKDIDAKVTAATSDFTSLNKILKDMTGTDGSLDDIQAAMNTIVKDIETAWKNATAGGIKVPVSASPVTINPTLSNGDSATLKTIANNARYGFKITGAPYNSSGALIPGTVAAAEGGYITGPGTSTSDSINAKLSNGEYVVKASSVKSIGVDVLNAINQTGSINDAARRAGRNGDTVVAHLNVREVEALARSSQARNLSVNPKTGFFEFFNGDAGAIGSIFRQQEAEFLYNKFKDKFRAEPVISDYELEGSSKPETWSYHSLNWNDPNSPNSVTNTGSEHAYTANYFGRTPGGYSAMFEMLRGAGNIINTATDARKLELLKRIQAGYATVTSNNGSKNYAYRENNSYLQLNSKFRKGFNDIGWGPGTGFGGGNLLTDAVDMYDAQRGGYIAQPSQVMSAYLEMLNQAAISTGRNASPTLGTVQQFVDGMNKVKGDFTDFYMLTSGGLVGDDYQIGSGRDSVQALLEPGEFVLRKQAVDAMGLDNAIRLNSSGNVEGDVEVEINIINNGKPIETVSETKTRRENNKIVVDVLLDDIRTNGPITRQLRSIR